MRELRAVVRVGQIDRIAADELPRCIPEERLAGRRGVGAPAAGIDVGHEVGGVLGEQLVARLARLECLVGELHAFGHLVERVAEAAELRRLPRLQRGAGVQIAFADALGDVGELLGGPHLTVIAEQPGAADGQGDGGQREGEADEGLPVDGGEDGVTCARRRQPWRRSFRRRGAARSRRSRAHRRRLTDDMAAVRVGAHGADEAGVGKDRPELHAASRRSGQHDARFGLDHHHDAMVLPGDPVGELRERFEVDAHVDDAELGSRRGPQRARDENHRPAGDGTVQEVTDVHVGCTLAQRLVENALQRDLLRLVEQGVADDDCRRRAARRWCRSSGAWLRGDRAARGTRRRRRR